MTDQLPLDFDTGGRCQYGNPQPGQPSRCDRPATHAACWSIPTGVRAGSGRLDCCLTHANYYAEAWCDWWWVPGSPTSAWIEVLTAGHDAPSPATGPLQP